MLAMLRGYHAAVHVISAKGGQPLVPYIIVGENSQPVNVQHSAIARKFYCRVPPPVSVTEYLRRVHDYCPLSAGVYLATSLYIHRLAVLECAIVVTKRNAHRLVLAGLRVAMKALEDLYYPHRIIARVGGISEKELARLEISFCFLTSFDLAVDASMLEQHWELLRRGPECWSVLEEDNQMGMLLDILHCRNLGLKFGVAFLEGHSGLDADPSCPATPVGELEQANKVVEPACDLIHSNAFQMTV
ncbi:cyclin-domain-containing protein [Chaetomium tenue]|uniref:Cyclin-domain-containing protein n=1 Tax=Chaetomium tenue TaxID=1854479 RepID=A0ACB7P467_9PEZI|nr:cyclin-domain-containing protein [Chaetomium globosum]